MAASVGLFDGAVVYVWDAVIHQIRRKIEAFGTAMIKNVLSRSSDATLDELSDSQTLELAYQLNLMDKQGYLFLGQCREIRNQASVAHPSEIILDDREFIVFVSRCAKYGLSNAEDQNGVSLQTVINLVENESASQDAVAELGSQIENTFELQRDFFVSLLYAKYVNPSNPAYQRDNVLKLMITFKSEMSDKSKAELLSRHMEILAKGDTDKKSAANSRRFFSEVGMLSDLGNAEQVAICTKAIENLQNAHEGFNNFYNEPPFAERLEEISLQISPLPSVVIPNFVNVVFQAFLGNPWGVSTQAMPFYSRMLQNLTPQGIEVLLGELSKLPRNILDGWKVDNISSLVQHYEKSTLLNEDQKALILKLSRKYQSQES
ncbi:hypothetical protein [Lacticaseibacillus paracasei]|uniref:hypothetical protein n=2 Tax=Lacticaseibacillus paracasei TaxID=1597 RepID=UPI000297C2DA|nr:hypothetical protein [Lacticaseibacillus paracasei]EKQ26548.1 hypothetical protein LCALC10_1866 [Lacticaseibacillus paracasei]ERN49325.1 hypothetical protein N422_08775 [Lacticaseibacillus paracasei]